MQIKESKPTFGVKYIYKRRINKKSQTNIRSKVSSSVKRGRIRKVNYQWYKEYRCHRFGEKQARADQPKGGVSGRARDLQKKSKS